MLSTVRAMTGAAALCFASTTLAQTTALVTPTPPVAITVARPADVTTGSMLPSNTEIHVALDNELTSKKAKVGDKLSFKVARDVMLGQVVVIPRGTPASGKISFRTGKGVFGKSAKLEFDIESLNLGTSSGIILYEVARQRREYQSRFRLRDRRGSREAPLPTVIALEDQPR